VINAVRTLLMNRGRDGYAHDFPGEEFVDPAFKQRSLPPHLLRAHQTLFGREPDRLFLNYRVRQLMTFLHSTELADFIVADDPRLTYLPLEDTTLFDAAFTVDAIQIGHSYPLYLAGTFEADEGRGIAQQVWRIEAISPDSLRIERQRPSVATFDIHYGHANGLSAPIILPGTDLTIRFNAVPDGTAWRVEAAGRPQTDIGVVISRLETSLGDAGVSQVFPPLPPEPVATYLNIWNKHPLFVYRFSALLLAIAAQVEQAPQVR
jgi:hypothetical protein